MNIDAAALLDGETERGSKRQKTMDRSDILRRAKITDKTEFLDWSTLASNPLMPVFSLRPAMRMTPHPLHGSSPSSLSSNSSATLNGGADETIPDAALPLDRLLPTHIPYPLRHGRILLHPTTDRFEWIPPANGIWPGAEGTSIRWNPTTAKWRVYNEERELKDCGQVRPVEERTGVPTTTTAERSKSGLLARGDCDWHDFDSSAAAEDGHDDAETEDVAAAASGENGDVAMKDRESPPVKGEWRVAFPIPKDVNLSGKMRWVDALGRWEWVLI